MRRLADIVLSSLALVVSSPLMIIIGITIKLHDGGPMFFYQQRVGRDLKVFRIIKFRTMRVNNEGAGYGSASESDLAAKRAARVAFKTTIPNDPRITPIGQKIRAMHLDELPQFINVLKGDMSLVGVRPDTPAQEVDYEPAYWKARHQLRPGLTGPAQIRAKNGDLEERTRLELEWLSNPTFGAFVSSLVGTIKKILHRSSF